MIRFTPLTEKRIKVFFRNKLSVVSLFGILGLTVLSLAAPLIANNHPIIIKYHGEIFFPALVTPSPEKFGVYDSAVVDFSRLELKEGDFAVYPLVRFNPFESNPSVETYPSPPTSINPMGTDDRGRDVFARLLYGFRYSFVYSIGVWIVSYAIGVLIGLFMGFFGGRFDFVGQRIVEVLSSVPQFFLLIILISVFEPSLGLLVFVSSIFGWISISYYMRAEALKIRKMEYIEAARALGLSTPKIIVKHLLPNALTPLITFSPFAIAAGITGLAALDYLGFGLTPPTPSWGELLNQAKKHFTTAWWLALYPSMALFITLSLLNFVGEGLRNAFDPKS